MNLRLTGCKGVTMLRSTFPAGGRTLCRLKAVAAGLVLNAAGKQPEQNREHDFRSGKGGSPLEFSAERSILASWPKGFDALVRGAWRNQPWIW